MKTAFISRAALFPLALLLTRGVATSQCCGGGGANPWGNPVAAMPAPAKSRIHVRYTGTAAGELRHGDLRRALKPVPAGSPPAGLPSTPVSVPYNASSGSAGGVPAMPGETPSEQLQNPGGAPYTGDGEATEGEENKKECEPPLNTEMTMDEEGSSQSENKDLSGNKEDPQPDNNAEDGKEERPPITFLGNQPSPSNDSNGAMRPSVPAPATTTDSSVGGGNSARGGMMEGTPASPVDVPARQVVAQKLGATPNGKSQTGYILLKEPAVGAAAANPLKLDSYIVREQNATLLNHSGTGWKQRTAATSAGTVIQYENTTGGTMTFSFYDTAQVDIDANPPAPLAGAVPFREQVMSLPPTSNPSPSKYATGLTTQVKEHGSLMSTRTVWTSANPTTVTASSSQYRETTDLFPAGASIWEEWSSVRTGAERVVTVKMEYRLSGVTTGRGTKITRYKLFDWGEEMTEERIVIDPADSSKDLVTTYTWWGATDVRDPNYAQLKLTTWPDGSWLARYRTREAGTGTGGSNPPAAGGGVPVSSGTDLIEHEFSPLLDQAPPAATATTANLDALKPFARYVKTRLRADYRQERQEYVGNGVSSTSLVAQTLPGGDAEDWREVSYEFTDTAAFFVTVLIKNTSGFFANLPLHSYRLKENFQDEWSDASNILSHILYQRTTAAVSSTAPFYTLSVTPGGSDPYRVTDIITDPERLPCRMSRTVTDRVTGNVIATEEHLVTGIDWTWTVTSSTLLDRQYYTRDGQGRPLTLTRLDGRQESWSYGPGSRVTHTDSLDVTKIQETDEFGRVTLSAITGVPSVSYSGIGTVTLPAQSYWVVTTHAYSARTGSLTGSKVTLTTKARSGGLTGTEMAGWQRVCSTEQDGADREVASTNALGRTDYYLYSLSGSGGEVIKHSLNSSGFFPLVTGERHRDGRLKSRTGSAVTDTWYKYGASAWRETTSMGFDATLTASLGVRVTETDSLGRVTKITQPRSTAGTATAPTLTAATDEIRTYNSEGLLASRQFPGSTAGTSIYDLYSYSWTGTGGTTESPHRVVSTARSADATLGGTDTNWRTRESYLKFSGSLWWEITLDKAGATPVTAAETHVAAGPMNLTGGYSRRKVISLGTTDEWLTARKTFGTPAQAVHETRHSRNGTLVAGTVLRNGLAVYHRQNGDQLKSATFSVLREPLMEPDAASTYWVTRTLDGATGLVTQRVGPHTGETLTHYTGQDIRAGLVKKVTPLNGAGPTFYTYNAAGQVTAQWGSGTSPAVYEYDEWQRMTKLITFRSATGQTADPDTNPDPWTPVTTTSHAAATTWTRPPWLDLVRAKTYAAGSPGSVTYTYHPGGQLQQRIWQRGVTTTYGYNTTGQLSLTDYSDSTPDVSLTWDSSGFNTGRTDGIGTWTLTYAADGRLIKETTGSTARANEWMLDFQGKKVTLKSQYSSSAVNPHVSYYYDSYGRLGSAWSNLTLSSVTAQYSSSTLRSPARTFSVNVNNGFSDLVMSKSSTLTAQGEISGLYYTAYGEKQTYYDENGEPYEVQPSGSLAGFAYTRSYGRVSKVTDSFDASSWNYQYDARSQVSKGYKQFNASPSQIIAGTQTQYTYDQLGNRLVWKEGGSSTLDSGLREHYYGGTTTAPSTAPAAGASANALNQYLSIQRPQAFDVTGNRPSGSTTIDIRTTLPASSATPLTPDYQQNTTTGLYFRKEVSHSSATNGKYTPVTVNTGGTPTDFWQQYIAPASELPTYDADGNVLTDGRWTYGWDAENRLVSMESPAQTTAGNPVPGTRLLFSYDGLSRRSRKEVYSTVPASWTLTLREHYVYDGWNLVLTARENNVPTPVVKRHATYVWGPDLGSMPYAKSDWQQAGGVDGLLMVIDGEDSSLAYQNVDYNGSAAGLGTPPADPVDDHYFPVTDHLGNVRALHKAVYPGALTPAAIVDYDPFGRELRSTGRAADIVPFHFSTKFTDPESGLNYYGYRYYDPVNGRWLGRDPLEEGGGGNLFVANFNNSVSNIDFLGLQAQNEFQKHHWFPRFAGKGAQKLAQKCPGINIDTLTTPLWSNDKTGRAAHNVFGGPSYNNMMEDALNDAQMDCCEMLQLVFDVMNMAATAMLTPRSDINIGPPGSNPSMPNDTVDYRTGRSTKGEIENLIKDKCGCPPGVKSPSPARSRYKRRFAEQIAAKSKLKAEELENNPMPLIPSPPSTNPLPNSIGPPPAEFTEDLFDEMDKIRENGGWPELMRDGSGKLRVRNNPLRGVGVPLTPGYGSRRVPVRIPMRAR